ncbi:MAG: cell wall hydrolase [Clostridia bacterium]|nr:cell wall hydrolase [Clostridia bacterium]
MKHTMKHTIKHTIRRRFFTVLLTLLLLIPAAALPAYAAAGGSSPPKYGTVPVYINGARFSHDAYIIENGVTYLPLRALAEALLTNPKIRWDSARSRAEVRTASLTLTAEPGSIYITANGRYLALSGLWPAQTTLENGVTYVPVRTAVRAMGGEVSWNAAGRCVEITANAAPLVHGDRFYDAGTLYWLSRIIYAEAGDQSLRGQLAVGAVVMNRVRSDSFPNTVYGVIFDRKWGVQFTPTANGAIYKTPSAQSIIAAKLVMDGCRISEQAMYFLDPTLATNDWIVHNRPALFSIGCHDFYS